jgi:hypothetical protein
LSKKPDTTTIVALGLLTDRENNRTIQVGETAEVSAEVAATLVNLNLAKYAETEKL